jgi:DNA-binding GntR family transcriptional regulator
LFEGLKLCIHFDPDPVNAKKLKRPDQTADQVFRRLIEASLRGELSSGQPLPEVRLAQGEAAGRAPPA